MPDLECPFSDEECGVINDALAHGATVKDFLGKCELSGCPMPDQLARLQKALAQLNKLKAQWFPDEM